MSSPQTIRDLCAAYQAWAPSYYRKHGQATRTVLNIRDACRELLDVWPDTLLEDFAPPHLRAVQQAMDRSGRLSRRTVNDRVTWIRSMVQWGVEMGYVNDLLPHRLATVRPLKPGRCHAGDRPPVRPVAWETVSETIAHAPLMLATMVELQWWTGMRPGELCVMRPDSIDRTSEVWTYTPIRHKTEHHGKARTIAIGPVAVGLLAAWLPRVDPAGWCWPGRDGVSPMRPLSYYRAIRRINERLGIPHWHPNQIRHAAATRLRKAADLDAARAILGHAKADTTEIYAERDRDIASRTMHRFG